MRSHPRVQVRSTDTNPALVRVLVHAPSTERGTWVEAELRHPTIITQIGYSLDAVIAALVLDPPPRPQVLVIDFDELTAGDIMHLHVLREQGWFGRIVALGNVPPSVRDSLRIDHVLGATSEQGALRTSIAGAGFLATTARLPVL